MNMDYDVFSHGVFYACLGVFVIPILALLFTSFINAILNKIDSFVEKGCENDYEKDYDN